MRLYAISLQPLSGFGTPMKGDTLFGHFCWQAAYDPGLLNGGLDRWSACYGERPCVVFSSAVPFFSGHATPYAVKRPDLPRSVLFGKSPGSTSKREQMELRKQNDKKKWMLLSKSLVMDLGKLEYRTDAELASMAHGEAGPMELLSRFDQPHNTVHRLTGTTGTGPFAPFSEAVHFFAPNAELAVFVLVDPEATDIERVRLGLERIGQMGFGKNGSTGLGRFRLGGFCEELPIPAGQDCNACYALAPVVPEKGVHQKVYSRPFVRFGKHGDRLARSPHPFKNPVIMADEGAVIVPGREEALRKPYIGTAVLRTSKALSGAMMQGYAPYLPMKLEDNL